MRVIVPQAAAVPQQLKAVPAVTSGEYANCSLEEDCIQMNACVSGPSKAEDDDDIPLLEINIRSNSNLKKCQPDFDGFSYVCCKRNRPQVQQSYAPPTKEFNFGDRRIGPSADSLNQGPVPATYQKPATENQRPTPENQRQSGQTQRISAENQGSPIIRQRPAQVQQLPNEPLQPGNVNQGPSSQPPVYKTLQLPRLAGDSVIFPNSQVKFESDPRIIQGPFSIIIPKPEQIRPGERIRIRLNSNVGASTVLGPDTPVQFATSSNTNGAESPAPSRVTIRDEPLVPLPSQSRPSVAVNNQVAPSSDRISSGDSTIPASLQRRSQPPLGSTLGFTNQEISRVTITDQPSVPRPINTLTRPINSVPNQPSSFTVRDESLLTLQLPRIESVQSEQKSPSTASLSETTSQISLIELDKNANYVVVTPKSLTTQKTTTAPTPKPFFPGFTNPPPVQPYTPEDPAQKLTQVPITVDDTSSESGTAPSNSLFNSFGTNRKVEYILSSSGEKVRVPSQYYEPPSLTPEDFFKLIQLPASGSNPSSLSGQNGSNNKEIQFFSPVAKSTSSDHVESCPRNMKCLSENLCSTPDPSEGDSDDFDIRTQVKKPKRQKCRQPNLPVQGYCCYLRDDYVAAQQAQRDNPLGGAIGVRKNQNTCGVRRPGGSSLRSDINTNTTFGEFPWQVLILRNGDSSCGGAILDKRTILTTAKCLSGIALDDIKILVGEWDTGSSDEIKPHQEISPKTVYIHPGFKYIGDTPVNDLALIVTSQKLKYEYHVSPVCLPDAITKFDDQRCIATGWFSSTPGARNIDKTLRKVHLPVVPVRRCKEKLRDTNLDLTNTHRTSICAGGESTTTTCTDHIGSPLVCEDEYTGTYALAGLASWSDCRDKTSRPALFTSIPVHIEWIAVIRQKERDELSKSA